MVNSTARVLIVDDEPRYVRAIKFNLQASGYETLTAADGESALALLQDEEVDLILLDLRMPGIDGFEVCRRVRSNSSVPIIMLTALAEDTEKVTGLDMGADDYITKPFGAEELMARIRSVLRRYENRGAEALRQVVEYGPLKVDFSHGQAWLEGQELLLTPIEFRLLCELSSHPGQVLVPEYLLKRVWGKGYEGFQQLLWQAVYRLRRKIEKDPQHPAMLVTKPGIGYVFVPPDDPLQHG